MPTDSEEEDLYDRRKRIDAESRVLGTSSEYDSRAISPYTPDIPSSRNQVSLHFKFPVLGFIILIFCIHI